MKKKLINQIKTEMSGVLNNAQRQKLKEVLVLLLDFYWRFIKLKVFSSVQFAIVQLPQRFCCIKYFLLPVAEILPAEVDSLPVVGVFKAVVRRVHNVLADKNMGKERRCHRGFFDYPFFLC